MLNPKHHTTMNGKFYVILYRRIGSQEWSTFEETEYTENEANTELRHLKALDSPYQFRKKCVYNGPVCRLSATGYIYR